MGRGKALGPLEGSPGTVSADRCPRTSPCDAGMVISPIQRPFLLPQLSKFGSNTEVDMEVSGGHKHTSPLISSLPSNHRIERCLLGSSEAEYGHRTCLGKSNVSRSDKCHVSLLPW